MNLYECNIPYTASTDLRLDQDILKKTWHIYPMALFKHSVHIQRDSFLQHQETPKVSNDIDDNDGDGGSGDVLSHGALSLGDNIHNSIIDNVEDLSPPSSSSIPDQVVLVCSRNTASTTTATAAKTTTATQLMARG